jgi:structure-specific recognition protein 1
MVLGEIFKGLTSMKIIIPGSYKSASGYSGLRCSLKANEAVLYPLEKSFLSIPKPTTLIPYTEVSQVTFSRVSTSAASSTRTFEMKISTDGGEYIYSSIPRYA